MSELKTLKDFHCSDDGEWSCCWERKPGDLPCAVKVDVLRSAAIEWIRVLKEEYTSPFAEGQSIIEWIKHFFHISEEELK